MVVVSTDTTSGATALVSVPRNLRSLPFPAGPLRDAFPGGFPDLANAVYVWGDAHRGLFPNVADAGIEALRQGLQEFTGWYIDDYVLVDMEGFVRVIDALGGIDLVTAQAYETGPLPGSTRRVGGFTEGEHRHLDGEEALAYSRSRTLSSDYARMRRQRCVVDAVVRSTMSFDSLSRIGEIEELVRQYVHTSVPLADLPALLGALDQIAAGNAVSLVLAPPIFAPADWTIGYVHALTLSTWQVATGQQVTTPGFANAIRSVVDDMKAACPK